MADIVIGVRAYAKMLLHAMKYPHHAVNGIFLAERKRNKEHNSGPVNIVDCVPLFHLSLSLTPMLEVAMMQVRLSVLFTFDFLNLCCLLIFAYKKSCEICFSLNLNFVWQ